MPLYAFGSNGKGQLGIGHEDDVSLPCLVSLPFDAADIADIVCGGNHTLLLTKSGDVFASGSNENGRCGFKVGAPSSSTSLPIHSLSNDNTRIKITHIAATWEASFFVTIDSRIYVCGAGNKGELGLGKLRTRAQSPIALALPSSSAAETISIIRSGIGHVMVLTSSGRILGWGNGRQGQLGPSKDIVWDPCVLEPSAAVTSARPPQDIVCGKNFTMLDHGGLPDRLTLLGPTNATHREQVAQVLSGVSSNSPSRIQSTWTSVFHISDQGRLGGWGKDNFRQLPPAGLPKLQTFAAGSEHVLAISEANEVLAWGWNEHGNCGSDSNSNGLWNHIAVNEVPLKVFAGCATSFIVTDHR